MKQERTGSDNTNREPLATPIYIGDLGFETYLEEGTEKSQRDQAVEKLMNDLLDAQVSPFVQNSLAVKERYGINIGADPSFPEIQIYTYLDRSGEPEELDLHPQRPHRHTGLEYDVEDLHIDAELLYEEDGKTIIGTSFRFAEGKPEAWNDETMERSTNIDLAINEFKRVGILPDSV